MATQENIVTKDVELDITKDDNILSVNPSIAKAPRAVGKSVLFIIIGAVLPVFTTMTESTGLEIILILTGAILLIVGIIVLASPQQKWKYLPSGEIFIKHKFYFNKPDKAATIEAINKGDLNELRAISAADTLQKNMAIVYRTKSGSCIVAQLFRYVPYTYIPDTEPIIIKK